MTDVRKVIEGKPANGDSLDIEQIMERLPHRHPFLLIDKLTQIVENESAVGIKNVTINEPFFQGHFPGKPVMPGVLIIEAMAQTAGCLVVESIRRTQDKPSGNIVYFMTIEEARFRRPVTPGDRLEMHVKKVRHRGSVWKFSGQAIVDGVVKAEATYSAMLLPINE